MAPKQGTLSNFVKGPSGLVAPQQRQSTLKFSHNAASKPEKPPVKDEEVELDTNDDALVKRAKDESDEDAHSPSKTLKRSNGVDIHSDEEPPVKRKRLHRGLKNMIAIDEAQDKENDDLLDTKEVSNERLDAKKPRKSVAFDAPVSQDKTSTIKRKGTPKKPSFGENNELPARASSPLVQNDPDATQPADNEATASEQETDSADEKPEIVQRAREKVQTTLTSKHNDAYPDWKAGDSVPYAALCTTFSKIEMTTKRLEIAAYCSQFLRQVLRLTPDDLLPTIHLMINKLAADYSGIELGIGESLIMKAIGETTGRSLQVIKSDQKEIGDLGLVAAKSRSNQPTMFKPKPLTVHGVHEGLMNIATTEGQGAQTRKISGIKKLLSAADAHLAGKGNKGVDITKDKGGASEAKYIIRTLEGKMRLGLAEKTVLVSLAQAMVFHESQEKGGKTPTVEDLSRGEAILKSVYNELPTYEVIIPEMLKNGIFNLRGSCKLKPGVPLKPMLAKPTKSITEVLDRFEGKDFSCEYKYDGERAQIHYVAYGSEGQAAETGLLKAKAKDGIANIFSRNSEDLSKKYPDILAKLPKWVKDSTKSFVLDCETVAWDLETKKVLPFQQLMTRKRKDVKEEDVKVKVCVFAFDILFLNGEALVNKPFRERRELLHSAFSEVESEFAFAKHGNTSDLEEIQILLEESVKASCEGLMVKMLDGPESFYEPSRRSQNWLKVKKDYLSGVGDSLDLVVLGAYYGKGKRTNVYGAFLLACKNTVNDTFESVCNIGTGFSEEVLAQLHAQLEPLIIDQPKPFYSHSRGNKDQPDVWFEATYVWEVKTADLTISPRYKAAADDMPGGKGVSLRFPRFLRVREDKKPDQATTAHQVVDMYRAQDKEPDKHKAGVDDDFEY